jgi:Helix-turn-helix domain
MDDRTTGLFRGPVYSQGDVARALNRSRTRVRQLLAAGKGAASVPGANGRTRFFSQDDVEALAASTGLPIRFERLEGEQ